MQNSARLQRTLLFGYELLRLSFIFTIRPEFSIKILPASWYLSVPLLCLPLILLALLHQSERQAERAAYSRVYAYCKFLTIAGFFPLMKAALLPAIDHGELTEFYSLKRLVALLIFLIIDVILALVLLLNKKDKPHIDNTRTECASLQQLDISKGEDERCK